MTHEEKINYMQIASGIVGYRFDQKGLDMLVSMYELVIDQQGKTDLEDIIEVRYEVEERDKERVKAEMLKEKIAQ